MNLDASCRLCSNKAHMMLRQHRVRNHTNLDTESAVLHTLNSRNMLLRCSITRTWFKESHLLAATYRNHTRINYFHDNIATMRALEEFCNHNAYIFKGCANIGRNHGNTPILSTKFNITHIIQTYTHCRLSEREAYVT